MNRRRVRILGVALAVLFLVPIGIAYLSEVTESEQTKRIDGVTGPDRDGYTVVTTQEFKATYAEAELVVLAGNGSTVHVNTDYDTYFDVDPVEGRPGVIEYVAADYLSGDDCDAANVCTREVFVRESFHTGESTVLWSRISPGKRNSKVHDVDRINESRVAVADLYLDRVFVVDLDRGIRVWTWSAQRDFPITGGGPYPGDWTHLNDVEVLADGTIVASLRNQDSVVFLSPNGTLQEDRTLGEDDSHGTIYEQHNRTTSPDRRPRCSSPTRRTTASSSTGVGTARGT
ncbi:MAG: hypothetical protein ABEJ40_04220 [Haloarculaceae archaeon]